MKDIFNPACRLKILCTLCALCASVLNAQVDLGQLEISAIKHGFQSAFDPITPGFVADRLIEQQHTVGSEALLPSITANIDGVSQIRFTISAPPGQRFLVQPPAGQTVFMAAHLLWRRPPPYTPYIYGALDISFGDIAGTPLTYFSAGSITSPSRDLLGFNSIQSHGFTEPISFSSITFTATLPVSNSGLGALAFTPDPDSHFSFYYPMYSTSQTTDPGSFVSLVPEPSPTCLFLLGIVFSTCFASAERANHALQRTRPSRRCCNRRVPCAGLLSLGR